MTDEQVPRPLLLCRLFGHSWQMVMIEGHWRFHCPRCRRVQGHCCNVGCPDPGRFLLATQATFPPGQVRD